MVVKDGIWRPKDERRRHTTSSWHEGDDDELSLDSPQPRFPGNPNKVVVMLDAPMIGAPNLEDTSSVGSTDYDNILQEVI